MAAVDLDTYFQYLDATVRAYVADCIVEQFAALKEHVPEVTLDSDTYHELLTQSINEAATVSLIPLIHRSGCVIALSADEAFFEQVRWRLVMEEGFGI